MSRAAWFAGGLAVALVACRLARVRLGDAVARAAAHLGFTPCAPCDERRRALNRLTSGEP